MKKIQASAKTRLEIADSDSELSLQTLAKMVGAGFSPTLTSKVSPDTLCLTLGSSINRNKADALVDKLNAKFPGSNFRLTSLMIHKPMSAKNADSQGSVVGYCIRNDSEAGSFFYITILTMGYCLIEEGVA